MAGLAGIAVLALAGHTTIVLVVHSLSCLGLADTFELDRKIAAARVTAVGRMMIAAPVGRIVVAEVELAGIAELVLRDLSSLAGIRLIAPPLPGSLTSRRHSMVHTQIR